MGAIEITLNFFFNDTQVVIKLTNCNRAKNTYHTTIQRQFFRISHLKCFNSALLFVVPFVCHRIIA